MSDAPFTEFNGGKSRHIEVGPLAVPFREIPLTTGEIFRTYDTSGPEVPSDAAGLPDRRLWHRDAAADQAFLDAQCLKLRLDSTHVAKATLFMASDDSDGMTGQHVLVDAGIAQQSILT